MVDSERCAPLGKRTGGMYHARLVCPFPALTGGWWWILADVLMVRSLSPSASAVFWPLHDDGTFLKALWAIGAMCAMEGCVGKPSAQTIVCCFTGCACTCVVVK